MKINLLEYAIPPALVTKNPDGDILGTKRGIRDPLVCSISVCISRPERQKGTKELMAIFSFQLGRGCNALVSSYQRELLKSTWHSCNFDFLMKVLVPSLFQSARETKILQVLAIVKNEDFIILFMYSYLAFDHSKFAKHFVIQNLLAGLHNLVNFV